MSNVLKRAKGKIIKEKTEKEYYVIYLILVIIIYKKYNILVVKFKN